MNTSLARIALQSTLAFWMPAAESKVLLSSLHGEEAEGIAEVVLRNLKTIEEMPETYAQEAVEDPTVYLHYFKGGCDWYITEKDVQGGVDQAFGYANLGDPQSAELGYISIAELVQNGCVLDLYFTPTLLSVIKAKQ